MCNLIAWHPTTAENEMKGAIQTYGRLTASSSSAQPDMGRRPGCRAIIRETAILPAGGDIAVG